MYRSQQSPEPTGWMDGWKKGGGREARRKRGSKTWRKERKEPSEAPLGVEGSRHIVPATELEEKNRRIWEIHLLAGLSVNTGSSLSFSTIHLPRSPASQAGPLRTHGTRVSMQYCLISATVLYFYFKVVLQNNHLWCK